MNCFLLVVTLCAAIHDKPVAALTAAHTAAIVADGITTRQFVKRGEKENFPITDVILGQRPTWARMAPIGAVLVIGQMYLAERMRRSHNDFLRHVWWIPQVFSIQIHAISAAGN